MIDACGCSPLRNRPFPDTENPIGSAASPPIMRSTRHRHHLPLLLLIGMRKKIYRNRASLLILMLRDGSVQRANVRDEGELSLPVNPSQVPELRMQPVHFLAASRVTQAQIFLRQP